MIIFWGVVTIIIGYLCGSMPMGYWIARLRGIDLLQSGSGKIGGTNVLRSVGLVPSLFSILGDVFKGLIPTYVAVHLFPSMPWIAALTGAAAVLGHNHSIFIKFRGGVGAATALAALSALSFPAALTGAVAAIIAISITRYASMASFSSCLIGLIMLVGLSVWGNVPSAYIIYGVLSVALVSWGLRNNFSRIRNGTERRIGVQEENIKKIL